MPNAETSRTHNVKGHLRRIDRGAEKQKGISRELEPILNITVNVSTTTLNIDQGPTAAAETVKPEDGTQIM